MDAPAPRSDDPLHDGQPEARPLRARAELGFEDAREHVGRDSGAVVGHGQDHRLGLLVAAAGRDDDPRPVLAGEAGILEEVHQDLLELGGPRQYGRQAGLDVGFESDPGGRATIQRHDLGDDVTYEDG